MVAMLGQREQLALLLLTIFAFQHSEGFFKKLITIEDDGNNYESNEHVNLKFPTVKLLKPFNFFEKKKEKLENEGDALGALIENKLEKWEAKKEKFDEKLLDLIDTLKEKEPTPVSTPTSAPAPIIKPPSVYGSAPHPAYHASAPYHSPEPYHAPPPHYPPAPYHAPAPHHAPDYYHSRPSAYGPQPEPSPSYEAPAPSYGHAPATSYKAPASTSLYEAAVVSPYRAPAPAYGSPSAYAYHSPTPSPKYGHSSHYYSHYKPSRPATPAPYRYYGEHDCSEEQTYSYQPVRPIRPKPKPKPDTHYHDCDYEVRYFT